MKDVSSMPVFVSNFCLSRQWIDNIKVVVPLAESFCWNHVGACESILVNHLAVRSVWYNTGS